MAARLTAFLVAVIVGISVVAGLIVGATREADPAVDLLIYNGRVYTGDPEAPIAEAIAIRGNRILRVGTNREIKRLRRNAGTVIDAHGGSILPGFADTYVTLPSQADAVAGVHRLGLTTVGAVVDDVAAFDTLSVLAASGERPLRVAAAVKVGLPLADGIRRDLDTRRKAEANGLVRLDAVAYDVALPEALPARRPAARRAPDPSMLPNEQQEGLLALDRDGWPLVLHVDDERELDAALDVVARLIETNAAPSKGRRHRVVLARPMPLDTARLATLGVTVAMPLPATWTGGAVVAAPASSTPEGAPGGAAGDPAAPAAAPASATVPATATAAATVTDAGPASAVAAPPLAPAVLPFSFPLPAGVRLVMGSEIVADPRLGLHALVGGATPATTAPAARADADDAEAEAAADRDVVTSALATLTTGAAQALGASAEWGTIEPGRLADLVVLSADLFELPASRLLDAVVIATVVDGKVVYDRDTDVPPPTP
jgi:predicted amidohydrolase YtcJ